ncbi:MAG: T9SS type A sorting domain-containing protein [Bacteroidetes bacterium]|nr:T9SS type A sorting domain-containing protein [Bacteroidota bacterium]
MKKLFTFLLSSIFVLESFAQSSADAAVQINATVQTSTPQITLNWVGNTTTTSYQIFRKLKTATSWGVALATLTGTVNQYVDNTVSVGTNYEYRVIRSGSGYTGYGYINSGINVPVTEYRGKLILLVDSTFITSLNTELKRLQEDLEGDGWDVLRHNVLRTATPQHVRSFVQADYALDPTNTKAVFIVGHVPVPYSGNINPDGHPDHLGAWPTDTYYADVNGVWTDVSVTSTTASPARTQNNPADGKFDQSVIPSDLELQVGRADFANLTTFTLTETQLLKNYLDKDHDYRKKVFTVVKRAVIDDNFGYFSGEAFAASGYKNAACMVPTSSITAADYFTSMTGNNYQWSYGCGGGTYTSASGIGNTTNFSTANLQGVFTMLFGSYFGDWDSQNNFLRAALAQGKVLTNVWSGRVHYQLHHMGLGENIGYGVKLTQNSIGSLYFSSPTGITGRWIHHGLMGDPTLRNDVVAPVSNVVATKVGNNCNISWTASPEPGVLGYNIYMKNDTNTSYVKINSVLIAGTTYTDNCLLYKGIYKYMVRAYKLETTPSGSYYNMSEGIADTANSTSGMKAHASFSLSVSGTTVNVTNLSVNTTANNWNFGDGGTATSVNAAHTYTANGSYTITLISSNSCNSDTAKLVVNIISASINELNSINATVYPNPSNGKITVSLNNRDNEAYEATIYNQEGKLIQRKLNVRDRVDFDLSGEASGLYFLQLRSEKGAYSQKFVME